MRNPIQDYERSLAAVDRHMQANSPGEPVAKAANPAKTRASSTFQGGESVANGGENRRISPQQARLRLQTARFSAPDYPLEALGPLAEAAADIRDTGQVSDAMAGQSVLAAAALVTQHTANGETLAGIKPLSLYALTIADSGEGKSTAETPALQAVRDWQRERGQEYQRRCQEADRARRSRDKEAEPVELPPEPWLVMKDATVEGIRRAFANGIPSQGAFTSEAAVMMSGYGMSPENRAKTAGTFNALWDDGELSVARGTSRRIQLYDRRFSKHFLIQPDAARESLNDPLLETIGYWPRYLVAWPDPAPPRKAIAFNPEDSAAIRAYWGRCAELLDLMPEDGCTDMELIRASGEADRFIKAFFERMEIEGKTGDLRSIKPFALRATEQLYRIAGVLSAYSGSSLIDLQTAKNAAMLVTYSLETWRGIFGDRQEADAVSKALRLFDWMHAQGGTVSATAILKSGPRPRGKDTRDKSLAVLELAGLIQPCGQGYWEIAEG